MKNSVFEQCLNNEGVNWEYKEKILIEQIDLVKSQNNQARLEEPIVNELVEQYTLLEQQEGYEFPAIVLWQPGPKSKYIIIDGNNRTHAKIKANKTLTDAYLVISQDRKVIDRITWTFNNKVNGKRLTREECMIHAISYVRQYKITIAQAAKEWGVPAGSLQIKIKILDAKDSYTRIISRSPLHLPMTM